ncbi:hypothetical protein MRX96_042281 [Rhipicephalus microplus]
MRRNRVAGSHGSAAELREEEEKRGERDGSEEGEEFRHFLVTKNANAKASLTLKGMQSLDESLDALRGKEGTFVALIDSY